MWVFIIFKVTTVQRTAQTVYVVTLSTSHISIQLPQHPSLSLMPLCNFLFCFFFSGAVKVYAFPYWLDPERWVQHSL